MLNRLVAGADTRKTRLHDELGNMVSFSRAVRNAPRAVATGIMRLAFGHRPVRPWISYDAQRLLAGFLTPHSRVLEFGSGMSTVWYAAHAGEVVSIEDYQPWFLQVAQIIRDRKATNIRYRFARGSKDYSIPTANEQGEGFDLIMIDGSFRDQCVERSLRFLKPCGIVYLDNSDKGDDTSTGDIPRAREMVLEFAKAKGAEVKYFTDFAPTQFFAQQGLLVYVKSL